MGTDMFLFKSRRVDGLSPNDYRRINEILEDTPIDPRPIDLERMTHIKGSNQLLPFVKKLEEGDVQWYTILDVLAHWRNAWPIHQWFVATVMGNKEKYGFHSVSRSQLEDLLDIIEATLHDIPKPMGSKTTITSTFDLQVLRLRESVPVLENILDTVDFDQEVVFYHFS